MKYSERKISQCILPLKSAQIQRFFLVRIFSYSDHTFHTMIPDFEIFEIPICNRTTTHNDLVPCKIKKCLKPAVFFKGSNLSRKYCTSFPCKQRSETHSELSKTSKIGAFCESSYRLKSVNYFYRYLLVVGLKLSPKQAQFLIQIRNIHQIIGRDFLKINHLVMKKFSKYLRCFKTQSNIYDRAFSQKISISDARKDSK